MDLALGQFLSHLAKHFQCASLAWIHICTDDIISSKRGGRGGRRGAFRRGNPQRQSRREQTPYKRNQFSKVSHWFLLMLINFKGNIEGAWKHDMFDENEAELEEDTTSRPATNRRLTVRRNSGGGRGEAGAKVELENLEFSIDDESLRVKFNFPVY